MKKKTIFSMAAALAAALFCTACGNFKTTATTMHLMRAEGSVEVADYEGKSVEVVEQLKLYSGYEVDTAAESYAWVNLDSVKLTKMDEKTEIEISKLGNNLNIQVKSGSLFFHVTEPLGEDEVMNIRTATTMVGIRGTCGWVTVDEQDHLRLYLLEGTVQYTYEDPDTHETQTAEVNAGETAELVDMGDGTFQLKTDFSHSLEIPAFIRDEVEAAHVQETLEAYGISLNYGKTAEELEAEGILPGQESGEEMSAGANESEETPEDTEETLTMPVTAEEIFSKLWSGNTETLIVKSDGGESTLDINYIGVPEGKTLILEEGIHVNLLYPEDFDEKSTNLYVQGNMVINGNVTMEDGELCVEGGTLQINGTVTVGKQGWLFLASDIHPENKPRLIVTEGIDNYGRIDVYTGTLEADIRIKSGGGLGGNGEIIGEVTRE